MIQDDWTLDFGAKTITHTSGTTVYTVNALYSYVMDSLDELSTMDDTIPMTAQTPTDYTLTNGWTIPDASFAYLKTGSVKDSSGDNQWQGIQTAGNILAGTQIYIVQNGSVITGWWGTGHIDVLIKIKSGGTLIDSGNVYFYARRWGYKYSYWKVTSTSASSILPAVVNESSDINNLSVGATVAGWSDVVVTVGTSAHDLSNGAGGVTYLGIIDMGGRLLSQGYERLKYITQYGATALINSIQGQIFTSLNSAYEIVQDMPFGTLAGGKFFGARGWWVQNYNATDAKNFQLIDASGTIQNPPNVVSVIVGGLVSGDRVLVTEGTSGTINKAKYTLYSGNNAGNATIVMNTNISSDTPQAGVVRIGDDRYSYVSWATKTFTLGTTLTSSYGISTTSYVPLIDQQASSTQASNTLIYNADLSVVIRVRKKGIIPYESLGTVQSTGLNVTAIRTTDSIVT